MFIGLQNDREWAVLCERILHRPDLIADDRFATNPDRVANDEELTAIIEDALKSVPAASSPTCSMRPGSPTPGSGPRRSSRRTLSSRPGTGGARWTRRAARSGPFSPPSACAGREAAMGAVPALGQHTAAILAELGLDGSHTQ